MSAPDDEDEGGAPAWGDTDDPATQAMLARWFGGTGGDKVTATAAVDPNVGFSRDELDAYEKVRAAAIAAVDPGLLESIELKGKARGEVYSPLAPIELSLEQPHVHDFRPEAWGMHYYGEPGFKERPEDIPECLKENTPQAVLRDLYRPERYDGPVFLKAVDLGVDPTNRRGSAAVREVMSARYKIDVSEHPSSSAAAIEHIVELRAILAQPWDKIPRRGPLSPEEERQQRIEAMMAFAGVDPDQ